MVARHLEEGILDLRRRAQELTQKSCSFRTFKAPGMSSTDLVAKPAEPQASGQGICVSEVRRNEKADSGRKMLSKQPSGGEAGQ